MAIKAVAFTGLGQIIADGGITAAASLISQGYSDDAIEKYFDARYEGVPKKSILEIIGLAVAGIAAGSELLTGLGDILADYADTGEPSVEFTSSDGTYTVPVATLSELISDAKQGIGPLAATLPISGLPEVSGLFGDDPQGLMTEFSLETQLGTQGPAIRIGLDFDGTETYATLLERVLEYIDVLREDYPEKFADYSDVDMFPVAIGSMFGVRRGPNV